MTGQAISQHQEVLLFVPPVLCAAAWIAAQAWSAATEGKPRPRALLWWRRHEQVIYLVVILLTTLGVFRLTHAI